MDKQTTDQAKLIFADVFNIKTETTFKTEVYGKMEYSLTGKAMFVPSKRTNKARYTVIHSDKYLEIKETDKDLIFKVQAGKGYFADKKTVKPIIETFDWAKQFINNDIKARQNHKKKRLIPTTHPTTQG